MTGTLSWTVPAVVAFNAGIVVYQIAYPIPEANAPDETAYQNPARSTEVPCYVEILNSTAIGTARRKFPAVTLIGSPAPLPRNE